LEPGFGFDFSQVRVHSDALSARSAEARSAAAYTVGQDIVFGPAQYSPGSRQGRQLIAHELSHVVQQAHRRPSLQSGIDGGAADALEKEADRLATRALASPRIRIAQTGLLLDESRQHRVDPSTYPMAVPRPVLRTDSGAIQRRSIHQNYASAAQMDDASIGPLWDVSLTVTGAPEKSTEDSQEFTSSCHDGIAAALYQLGNAPSVSTRKISITMPYKSKQLSSDVSRDAYALALRSAGIKTQKEKATTASKPLAPQPVAPPTALPPSTQNREQAARLELVRKLKTDLQAAFDALDAALPATPAYDAFVKVRNNVMDDVARNLGEADSSLAGNNAALAASAIHTKLEQAQLWLFFVPPYAQLAALIRSAEHDRLIANVTVAASHEAAAYANAFTLIGSGTPDGLKFARDNALKQVENTKALLTGLHAAIAKGDEAVKAAEKVEKVLDVPIQYAAGRVIPVWALALSAAADLGGFYTAHSKDFDVVEDHYRPFFAELKWLNDNAPATKRLVLDPIYSAVGKDAIKSISAANVAFILGRTMKGLAAAGKATLGAFLTVLPRCAAIVLAIDSFSLVLQGLAKLATKTKEAALQALGGVTDPNHVIAGINRNFDTPLSGVDVAELLLELSDETRRDHLKQLAEVGKVLGPSLAVIVSDLLGTGALSLASTQAGVGSIPLLPPAP
jgi:hypothetical protein